MSNLTSFSEICSDSIDNDGDGLVDEFDPDCSCVTSGLPNLNFDRDLSGNKILAGTDPSEIWSAWGIHISTNDPINRPLMIYDSENPTNTDKDLGTPNEDFGGKGEGLGGEINTLGENKKALGNLLIISEDGNMDSPDDNQSGGTITFTFDNEVTIAALEIIDIDYSKTKGVIKVYDAAKQLIAIKYVIAYGDNSYQKLAINESGIRSMEVIIPNSFSIGSLLFCDDDLPSASIGDTVWEDTNGDGLSIGDFGLNNVNVFLLNKKNKVLARTLTNLSGNYLFEDLTEGQYKVVVQPPLGYTGTYDLNGGNDSNSGLFVMGKGEIRTDIDFGLKLSGTTCDGTGIKGKGETRNSPFYAKGVSDGITTEMSLSSDYLVITLADELEIGSDYMIHLKGVNKEVSVSVFEAPEGTVIPSEKLISPLGFTSNGQAKGEANILSTIIKTTQTPTKYIYITLIDSDDTIEIDAITYTQKGCLTEICDDGIDNDLDGLIDCADPDCGPTLLSVPLQDDTLNLCPGVTFTGRLALKNSFLENKVFKLVENPVNGVVNLQIDGKFEYIPYSSICGMDKFTYEICDTISTCCSNNTLVHLSFSDNTAPTLLNVPDNITLSCDEVIPAVPDIFALDNCPLISLNVKEENTQGKDGCSIYDYTITRTWIAKDQCENTTSDTQIIEIEDVTAPDIFRIYTLPNGKKMVAGVMEYVNENWKIINLPIDFETQPIIFHQVVSANETTPVISQIRNISSSQFELRLQEDENSDNLHTRENIAWIAMEAGIQTANYMLEVDTVNVSDKQERLNFTNDFATSPLIFTSSQTNNEPDPFIIRPRFLTKRGVNLKISEEISKDTELNHIDETIGYLALENIGDIRDKNDILIGEIGENSLTNNWTTINLAHTFHNPVIIINRLESDDIDPAIIRVKNIGLNTFEARIEEWEYLDGNHPNERVAYMVIEGSVPLESPNYCDIGEDGLVLGIDIRTIDNCDANTAINYSQESVFNGATKNIIRNWSAEDECGNRTQYSQVISCEGVALRTKMILQGALLGSKEEGLMRDDLRKKELLPEKEPYTAMKNFQHFGKGGGETIDSEILNIEGKNAIVDWVFVELRAASDREKVIATVSGLLQRDGDVVSPQGDTIIYFENTRVGDYFVSVRHRNHLGIISFDTFDFSPSNIPLVDFTHKYTPVSGANPTIRIGELESVWSGDLNNDEKVIFQGPNNDIFHMFLQVILDTENKYILPNFISKAYTSNDFNLDGQVIYQGPNNDRSNLLFNTILNHPNNTTKISNYIIHSSRE